MNESASGNRAKTGSLSREAARNAVLEVKSKRAASGVERKVSSSFIERYLGRVGVGGSGVQANKIASRKIGRGDERLESFAGSGDGDVAARRSAVHESGT